MLHCLTLLQIRSYSKLYSLTLLEIKFGFERTLSIHLY
nr:MAG TPA: hypothetical protein [Caudoviricetes sp.]